MEKILYLSSTFFFTSSSKENINISHLQFFFSFKDPKLLYVKETKQKIGS